MIGIETMKEPVVQKIPMGRRGARSLSVSLPKLTKAEVVAARNLVAHAESKQQAMDAQELADKAKTLGLVRRDVRGLDGKVKSVWCFRASYHAMRFADHQIAAAERF